MARNLVPFFIAVAVLFSSLTLSHAHIIPANIPGDEIAIGEHPSSLPESDANPIIRLPSDSESHSNEPVKEEAQESETLSRVQSVPLKVVTFRPVDRRFRFRSSFPFRCRHHHHHHRFFMPMRQHQEIPYGDDMIVASGENADFDQEMFRGGVRRIPARWVKIHRHDHHDEDEDEDGDGISKLMFRHNYVFDKQRKTHERHHHHHEDNDEDDKEERFKEHKERKEKGGGFMKRIRKFLDHF